MRTLDELLLSDAIGKILRTQQRQSDMSEQSGQVRGSGFDIVIGPFYNSLENLNLRDDVQLVPRNEFLEIREAEIQKFFGLRDLMKILVNVVRRLGDEGRAVKRVREMAYSKGVVGIEAFLQKIGARVLDFVQLEERCSNHHALHVLVVQSHLPAVCKVYQSL